MSFQAMAWAVRQKVGNATGKAILLMLANYADDAGACFPGQGKLATECECSERTVREWLSKFEEMGLVRRDERRRSDGYRTSDGITLSIAANRPTQPTDPAAEISPAGFSPENNSPENNADLTGSNCRAIHSQGNHQKSNSPASAKKPDPTPLSELSRVLSRPQAQAVIDHRQRIRRPMTAHAAHLLARQFEACPDPNAAADTMIENGWQGFKPAWIAAQSDVRGSPIRSQQKQRDGDRAASTLDRMIDEAEGAENFNRDHPYETRGRTIDGYAHRSR